MAEKKPKSRHHKEYPCMCDWEQCKSFTNQIREHTNSDDVWNGDVIRICKPKTADARSYRAIALRAAIGKHVPGFANRNETDYYIARHHFPRALLEYNTSRKVKGVIPLLNKVQVEHIADLENNKRLKEKCNQVNSLLRSIGFQIDVGNGIGFDNMYVQAPVVPKEEVNAFVSLHCSQRASRQQNRSIMKNLKPPPQPQPQQHVATPIVASSTTTTTTTISSRSSSDPTMTPPTLAASTNNNSSPVTKPQFSTSTIDSNPSIKTSANDTNDTYDIVTPSTHTAHKDMFLSRTTPQLPSATNMFSPQAAKEPNPSRPESPPLVQPAEFYQHKIKLKYNLYSNHGVGIYSALEHDTNFNTALFLLWTFHGKTTGFNPISLDDGKLLYPCRQVGSIFDSNKESCQKYCIRLREMKQASDVLCKHCYQEKRNAMRREARKNDETKDKTKRTLGSMSPDSLIKRAKNLQKEKRKLEQRLNRLSKKLDRYKDAVKINKNDPVRDVLMKTFDFVRSHCNDAKEQIINILLEMEDGGKITSSPEEQQEFAAHIVREIENTAKRMSGKDSQVRYSSKTIRIALALWLRDNKAYEEFQNSSFTILPSTSYLKSLKQAMKAREGNDPKVYCRFKDERLVGKLSKGLIGHLLFDEIKLKSDIAFNCKSNEVVGFVGNGPTNILDLKSELEKLVSDEDIFDDTHLNKEPAVYANQWHFRSAGSKLVHNAEFFFNSGNLSGDETLRQLMLVVTGYEMIGCKIFGICSDAGGSNAGLMKILRKGEKVEGAWPCEVIVSFSNPVDPSRKIYIWTCATHNNKAVRNSQHRSKPSGTRDFLRLEEDQSTTKFGWKQLKEAHERDEEQVKKGTTPDTDLTVQAVNPDKWNIMNYSLAKAVYSDKTLAAMFAYAGSQLGCLEEMHKTKEESSTKNKFPKFLSVLQNQVVLETTAMPIRETIRALEYSVAANGIFINRLANKEFKLTLDNIDEEEKYMIEHLSYFENWAKEMEVHKRIYNENKNKTERTDRAPWKKHFLGRSNLC